MAYVFWTLEETDRGKVTFIHNQPDHPEHGLTEEQKAQGLEVTSVPSASQYEGYKSVLYVNPNTGELWYEYVKRELTAEEKTSRLETELEKVKVSGRIATRDAIKAETLTESELRNLVDIYPKFDVGIAYEVGDLISYKGKLYEVIQAHTSQADWLPDTTTSLFTERMPAGIIPDWKQPTGAHDAYNIGDQVNFEGTVYESTIDGNVYSPLVYSEGWITV